MVIDRLIPTGSKTNARVSTFSNENVEIWNEDVKSDASGRESATLAVR